MRPDQAINAMRDAAKSSKWPIAFWRQLRTLLVPFFFIVLPLFILAEIFNPNVLWLGLVMVPAYGWWIERRQRQREARERGERR